MDFFNILLKLMHKIYRNCAYIIAFLNAVSSILKKIEKVINRIFNLLFFDKLDIPGCEFWEEKLKITEIAKDIEDRRAAIRAKWNLGYKTNLQAIQNACDSWKNGKVIAEFKDGIIDIKFVSDYGVPNALKNLEILIDDIKPAHLGYKLSFKYLLIEDIHEIKTIEEMQKIQIDNFAFGIEE